MYWFRLNPEHKKKYTLIRTTLKGLTGEVNNADHLFTMQYSAARPWILAFMWMPLDMHHPPKHCCRSTTPPHDNSTSWWWQLPPSAGVCTLPHSRNCSGIGNVAKSSRHRTEAGTRNPYLWLERQPCGVKVTTVWSHLTRVHRQGNCSWCCTSNLTCAPVVPKLCWR